jgi:hypothetical protein
MWSCSARCSLETSRKVSNLVSMAVLVVCCDFSRSSRVCYCLLAAAGYYWDQVCANKRIDVSLGSPHYRFMFPQMKMVAHLKKGLMQMDTLDDEKDGLILKDVSCCCS